MQRMCSHCGMTFDVAGEQAGETCNCTHCGKAMNVSSDGDAATERCRSFRLDLSPRSLRNGLLFMLVIVGCDAIGMGISVLLPAIQAAREPGRRTVCVDNLRQIGVAMQSYHQKYDCFPPSFIPDESGKPKHSWRVLILPFLGERELYAKYRFDEPWNGPHNKTLADQKPSVYRCPSDATSDRSESSYAMIVGPHAISDGPTSHCKSDIKPGLGSPIMVVESPKTHIGWMEPRDLNVEKDLQKEVRELFENHNTVGNVLFCDGSVNSLPNDQIAIRPVELRAMMMIDSGDSTRAKP